MYTANWSEVFKQSPGEKFRAIPDYAAVQAEVVEIITPEPEDRLYSDSPYQEGGDVVSIVFRAGDKFFKIDGWVDSYDTRTEFTGSPVEVEAVPRTTYTYREKR